MSQGERLVAADMPLDQVQVFDVDQALAQRTSRGRIDMALTPSSYIGVFQTAPRGGENRSGARAIPVPPAKPGGPATPWAGS